MPKHLFVDPNWALAADEIRFENIPVCRYNKTFEEEKSLFSRDELIRLYRDMRIVREFETMLAVIKRERQYEGISCWFAGPTHLCIGQEATVVGQAFCLDREDLIFGSHRCHGEFLAKGLSALEKMSVDEQKMVLKNQLCDPIDGLLYGLLAEIFGRTTGFNGGIGGSMHACCPSLGIMPNNAVVGGSAPLALGGALFKRCNDKPGIVVANLGDGALGRGSVMEAFHFASMDQIRTLWAGGKGLPLLFHVSNNFYAMGGQTRGETMGYDMPARLGAGFSPSQMHAERINGCDVLAVIDAMRRKKDILTREGGPVLLESVTYRTVGHSLSDGNAYRTPEEIACWQELDPVNAYRNKLSAGGVMDEQKLSAMDADIVDRMKRVLRLVLDEEHSPRLTMHGICDLTAKVGSIQSSCLSEASIDRENNSRVKEIAAKARFALDEQGNRLPEAVQYNIRDGIFEAILEKFCRDDSLIAYGEENRDWGGICGVYRGLTEALPYHRFFNPPISEAAIVGSAAGYAMCGGRALVEVMFSDFLGCAGDELINQLAKWRTLSGGQVQLPVVVRTAVGCGYGAQHSQDLTALAAMVPGLTVVYPATPYDAKGLMAAALESSDPVIFFESQKIYDRGEEFHPGGVPLEPYTVEIGCPDVKRSGEDVTVLTVGPALYRAMEAAELLEKQGISVEIIDARTLVPFDYAPVLKSVKKTGRILLVSDASERGSFLKNLAADIAERAFEHLKRPPVVYGAQNTIVPPAQLEDEFFPTAEGIVELVETKLMKACPYGL